MDSSLAKGFKRQVFNELEKELDKISTNWVNVSKLSKATKNLSHWDRYIEKLECIFDKNIILKQIGGSLRKPYAAFSVLTSGNRKYNQWHEKCLSSNQILINFDPWHVEVLQTGFNLSEHAVHRIFQRKFDNSNNYNLEDSGLKEIVKELSFSPLWSSYWIQEAIKRFANSDAVLIHLMIPTPSGLLFGEITRNHTGKVEIRTFVSDSLLSNEQDELKRKMLKINSFFNNSNLNFFPIIDLTGIDSSEKESIRMSELVTFTDEILSSRFIN